MFEYLARRYAVALYEVAADKNEVDEYIDNLKQIEKLIKGNSDLDEIINHPKVSTSKKQEIFKGIFEGKIEKEMLSFLLLLIEKDRISELSDIVLQMEIVRHEKNNEVIAVVKTVVSLDESERTSLINKLKEKYDKKIILKETIDKNILGGVYVRVGDDVIDGTIKYKLDEMKKLMLIRG
ncbi:MAG: F0F1 ATP synthase subunit delta [Clostridium sp.]|nr:F0F1 ATP synthase subunit delta [Clostridium sp.]